MSACRLPRFVDFQQMQAKLVMALLLVATQLMVIVALLALYCGWLV